MLIRSSPAKAGSFETPWHDAIDAGKGTAIYFGDKKRDDRYDLAEQSPGNKRLLNETRLHQSNARPDRLLAAPLVFFTSRPAEGMQKGHVRFEGIGVISRAELVSQLDPQGEPFPNYRFESHLISLAAEGEKLDWRWIDARRRIDVALEESLALAPAAWRTWVEEGSRSIPRVRRRLALGLTMPPADQLPVPGTPEDAVLSEVLRYYESRKHRFEALAAAIMRERLTGGTYVPGWISPPAGDGGWDIVGRLDVGDAARPVPLVVLGQAKCTNRTGVSAEQLARLVARLRRGWFGVFVTTGYVTPSAQVELAKDEYPLMLVCGRQVAETVRKKAIELTAGSVKQYLDLIDREYEGMISDVAPAEILAR